MLRTPLKTLIKALSTGTAARAARACRVPQDGHAHTGVSSTARTMVQMSLNKTDGKASSSWYGSWHGSGTAYAKDSSFF